MFDQNERDTSVPDLKIKRESGRFGIWLFHHIRKLYNVSDMGHKYPEIGNHSAAIDTFKLNLKFPLFLSHC